MLELVLLLGVTIGLATFLFHVLTRFATQAVAGSVEFRMRAAEIIVNEGQIPPQWLRPHQAKQAELAAKGAGAAALASLGRKAQTDCIQKINDLQHFFENDPIVDSHESRMVLLKALQKARETWENSGWEFFLRETDSYKR